MHRTSTPGLATPASNIPVELSSFIGRERSLEDLRALLPVSRLLTLTGAGGSGKTRLALELVRRLVTGDSCDVVWIELGALQDSALLAQHVAQQCGLRDEVRGTSPDALVALLRTRSQLLVFDNCEHLVDDVAALVDVLLRTCPDIRVLATSREALGVKGERAWLVPALGTPASDAGTSALLDSDAVRLFVERVRDAGEFELTSQNAATVGAICRRLDGIPLAIELAASRVRLLTPEQILARLDNAFAVLKSTSRTTIARHRTLAAAIGWSYDLLGSAEQLLLRRLSVFRGGFTLEAVEAACTDALLPRDAVLDVLDALVNRSLVNVRESKGVARYALLETVRQYAREKLVAGGEEDAALRRHAEWVRDLVATAEPHFILPERPRWIAELLPELENIRAALANSRTLDPSLHVSLAGSLWWFWFSTQHWTEAGRVLSDALSLPASSLDAHARAQLHFGLGALAALQSAVAPARAALNEAIALARESGDTHLEMYALTYLAMTHAGEASHAGDELAVRAAQWFEQQHDLYGLRLALLLRATIAAVTGDIAASRELCRRAVDAAREFGQPRELSISLQTLSVIHMLAGEWIAAERAASESLASLQADPSYFFLANSLGALAEVRVHQERWPEAARLFGAADRARALIGATQFTVHQKRQDPKIELARRGMGAVAFDDARAAAAQLRPEVVLEEVLAQVTFAEETPAASENEANVLRVRALGPLRVSVDGRDIAPDEWTYAKPKELLLWLLLHPEGGTRQRIAQQLWPGNTPAQLKNSFHVTLHHLRRTLGRSDLIAVERDRYRIAAGVSATFDAVEFLRAADAVMRSSTARADNAQIESVLARYGGDLLEDSTVADWLADYADLLRRRHTELSIAHAEAREKAHDLDSAVAVYERIIARDELHEGAHRGLMRVLARAGDRTRAIRHYERLATALREAIDAEPEEESVALFNEIRLTARDRER